MPTIVEEYLAGGVAIKRNNNKVNMYLLKTIVKYIQPWIAVEASHALLYQSGAIIATDVVSWKRNSDSLISSIDISPHLFLYYVCSSVWSKPANEQEIRSASKIVI